jgi:hypothetical protein
VFTLAQTIKSLLILAVANGTGTIKNAYLALKIGILIMMVSVPLLTTYAQPLIPLENVQVVSAAILY